MVEAGGRRVKKTAPEGYCPDTTPGRMGYLYHDPERFWKMVRPVQKL